MNCFTRSPKPASPALQMESGASHESQGLGSAAMRQGTLSICDMSLAESLKSKMSMFSRCRAGCADLGITLTLFWIAQRRRTCA
eukprot:CAMPEP_0171242174 /NCGR_PEP_ID=MMETSP0790-20130122/45528_1 /TAXON_ID=2925 /ORGANISM="Alexandrium catenella, Strain OF101" /LENGTH=83 /DNA_ID=CAMNT_0011708913 /DNA_START=273 /DNA_END=521 /DNA_ORIENTATION=-